MGQIAADIDDLMEKEGFGWWGNRETPQQTMQRHTQTMSELVPSRNKEAISKALKLLTITAGGAAVAGAAVRFLQHLKSPTFDVQPQSLGIRPDRDYEFKLPDVKSASQLDTARSLRKESRSVGDVWHGLTTGTRERVHEILEAGATPTAPQQLPWFLPAMLAAAPAAGYGGYKLLDYFMDKQRRGNVESQLSKAQREYETALKAEFRTGRKSASVNEAIDGLAQAFVSGDLHVVLKDLEKRADIGDFVQQFVPGEGSLGTAAGTWLALATLAGLVGHVGGKSFVEKRDPARARYKALREAVRARQLGRPPTLIADIG